MLPCDARCDGGSAVLRRFFNAYNEYCLMMMPLALALYLAPSPNPIPNPNQVLPDDDGLRGARHASRRGLAPMCGARGRGRGRGRVSRGGLAPREGLGVRVGVGPHVEASHPSEGLGVGVGVGYHVEASHPPYPS